MTDKQIIIDGINVSELTGEQLVCMNRYKVSRLFAKLVDTLSKTEDDYNNVQEDRVKMWTDNTGLTDRLKREEQDLETICKTFDIEYIRDKETNQIIAKCNKLLAREQECEALQMSDNEAREIVAELKAECKELRRSILKIFACLIKANKDKIIDTLWVDNVTTLWDYMALTLGVEGDQTQIEEQIMQEISEVLDD